METVSIYKAQPANGDTKESIMLWFQEEFPDLKDLTLHEQIMNDQAQTLHGVLLKILPGGVYDRLFALMATEEAGLFTISHFKPIEEKMP